MTEQYSDVMERVPKICLYGEFGKAKTVTAAMYSSNSVIYATDSGWTSLDNHSLKAAIRPYQGVSQLRDVKFEQEPFDTFILDTVNEMTEEYLDMLMDNATWGGKFRESLVVGSGAPKEVKTELQGMDNPAPADYHVIRNKFRPILRRFIKAPVAVFFIVHENAPIAGLSKDMTKKPQLSDKVYKVIAQDCHVIGRCTGSIKMGFKIDVEGNDLIAAKSRISTIKGKMSPEDFIQALQKWSTR